MDSLHLYTQLPLYLSNEFKILNKTVFNNYHESNYANARLEEKESAIYLLNKYIEEELKIIKPRWFRKPEIIYKEFFIYRFEEWFWKKYNYYHIEFISPEENQKRYNKLKDKCITAINIVNRLKK